MKATKLVSMMSLVLLLSMPFASDAKDKKEAPKAETEVPAEVQVMLNRLEEIKAMDKSEMTRSQKKELREEVKQINADMKELGGGVYLSAGAIIIIILLLILIL